MVRKTVIKFFSTFLLLITFGGTILSVQASPNAQAEGPVVISSEAEAFTSHFSVETLNYSDGTSLKRGIINGPSEPPAEYAKEIAESIQPLPAEGVLSDFPSYSWVFGCSAVSGAMIAGYYDRNGYTRMYSGPTHDGIMPLSDAAWPTWVDSEPNTYPNNPLIASHKGVDGRIVKGSLDDYWIKVGSIADDPYLTGSWAQHLWGNAIGDYMKTSQSAYGNSDGSTSFYYDFSNNGKLTCSDMVANYIHQIDGTYGRKLFYEARGYTVSDCYSQLTDNYMSSHGYSGGFTLADYRAQINAGNPVMLNVMGHTMVGYGYGNDNTIYIRNTWDNDINNTYTMQWGESYAGMELYQVSVVNIIPPKVPTPVSPATSTNTHYPHYIWTVIPGASAYQYEVYAGSYKMHTSTQGTSICDANYCTHTPLRILPDRGYTWRVRAKVSGVWQKWSAYKWFNVATNFSSSFTSDAKGWSTVFGPWSLYNTNFYRSTGWLGNFNSIAHDGLYPTFTYTVRMMRIGSKSFANFLYVRGAPYPLGNQKVWNNGYMFAYANDGYFMVWKDANGISTPLKPWTATGAINQNGWNLLKVVGNGTRMEYYINNKLVWVGNDSSLGTGRVGIGMYKDSPATPLWQPLLIDTALLSTTPSSSSMGDIEWADLGETNTTWDNPFMSPPLP